jgi:hypothetical protein
MTRREQELKEMRKFVASLKKNPEKTKEILVNAGIITPKGNLRKPYRNLCIPRQEA